MRGVVVVFILLFLASCSQKRFFEPKNVSLFNDDTDEYYLDDYIVSINARSATMKNNNFIDSTGVSKEKLPKNFEFLNKVSDTIIATNNLDSVYLSNRGIIKVRGNVIAATIEKDKLYLVFANNSIAIYDLEKKRFLLKKYYEESVLNDTRIAMPVYLETIILFPTLSGKVVVVDKKGYSTKDIPIDVENNIKNIIMLKTFDDTLVVATPNRIFSLTSGNVKKLDFFIQSYNFDNDFIYIATLDGKIFKLTPTLKIEAKRKYKFAKFQTISIGNRFIYFIESQGYVVKLDKSFKKEEIFTISFENDEKSIAFGNILYNGNKIFIFKQ